MKKVVTFGGRANDEQSLRDHNNGLEHSAQVHSKVCRNCKMFNIIV